MAFNVHSSGFFHNSPVAIQNTQATDNTAILSGYTSKLVSVTPTIVIRLANHPISLLRFSKKCKPISPKGKQSKHLLRLCLQFWHDSPHSD